MRDRVLVLTILLALPISFSGQQGSFKKKKLPQKAATLSSAELRSIGFDFVNALWHFSATVHYDEGPNDEVEMMARMLDDNRWLQQGALLIEKYKKHPNKVIRVAAEGTITGAELAQKANSEILALMRHPSRVSVEEIPYRVAEYKSRGKEAYMLIARSAPWVSMAMIELREKEQHVGPIPYKVTKKDREMILAEIDRLFGAEFAAEARGERNDKHNSMAFAASAIKRNLMYDTYEQEQASRPQAEEH